jgi:glycerol kinase
VQAYSGLHFSHQNQYMMKEKYILALDQGTSSSRAVLVDVSGAIVGQAQREFTQIFPRPGWVEHDPQEIWQSQWEMCQKVTREAGIEPSDIAAIGITNQRETTVAWDALTGEPVCNAIVWQDKRTAPLCERLKAQGLEPLVRKRTGLLIDIPLSVLPAVQPSAAAFGTLAWKGASIPIRGVAGDQQSALFGQACFEAGMAKNTYGTGCFMLMHTGADARPSQHGLLTTIACDPAGQPAYALEGSIFIAGAAIQWLRDGLHLLDDARDSEYFASKVADDEDEVIVVPALSGLGAPHWDMYARGAIFGLTRDTSRDHIVRSTLQSLAFQTRDVLEAMEQDAGLSLSVLKVDGGASANNYLMQFQADMLSVPVERPADIETTALGAAYLAGTGLGMWTAESLAEARQIDKVFEPAMDSSRRASLYKNWRKAVGRSRAWIEP